VALLKNLGVGKHGGRGYSQAGVVLPGVHLAAAPAVYSRGPHVRRLTTIRERPSAGVNPGTAGAGLAGITVHPCTLSYTGFQQVVYAVRCHPCCCQHSHVSCPNPSAHPPPNTHLCERPPRVVGVSSAPCWRRPGRCSCAPSLHAWPACAVPGAAQRRGGGRRRQA
jgi:hypothetical protein